jgi:multidrug efflux system membrane fusion protein
MRTAWVLLACVPVALAGPPDVAVIHPVQREVFDHVDIAGRIEASQSVKIRARVSGYLEKMHFKEGSLVKTGDLLFQIDDRLQRAELDKAQAEVKKAEAGLKLAQSDHDRVVKLGKMDVAREEADRYLAVLDQAKATVAAAQAALAEAKLNLGFTRIASPIDGRIGRTSVDVGNLVREADGLAAVYALDPVYAVIDLDERTLLSLRRFLRDRDDRTVSVAVALTGDEGFPRQAKLDLIDPVVDPKTGTIRARAVLPNPTDEMRPGQFVRVRVQLGERHAAVLLPEEPIERAGADGFRVLVVNEKNVIEERRIEVGARHDGLYVVTGLTEGDRVVRDPRGLKAGDEVRPRDKKGTPADSKPKGTGPLSGPPRPPAALPGTGPALVVTATYPGANTTVLEDTVAAPIGRQIDGLEGMTHRLTACADDGTVRMTLLFPKGTDLNRAMVLAQNRVALAEPALPDLVRRLGITVRKRGVYLGAVAIVSPSDRYDRTYLMNYTSLQVRDELARVAGIADATFYGDAEPGPRVHMHLDPDKLAAIGLTAADVTAAVQQQNVAVESSRAGPIIQGQVSDPEALGEIVIKADKDGRTIRLRNVARLEMVSGFGTTATVDGKAAAVLLVSRLPDSDAKDAAKALKARVAELAKHLPEGLEIKVIDGD